MPENDLLSSLIDAALSTYAYPGPGLDQRILARISAQAVPVPRLRWLPWAIALSAAACLLIVIVVSGLRHVHAPLGQANMARQVQHPSMITTSRPALRSASPRIIKIRAPQPQIVSFAASPAPLPKLDVFPAPQPLTPEEQALFVFTRHATAAELQALIEAQKQDEQFLLAANKSQPLVPPLPDGN